MRLLPSQPSPGQPWGRRGPLLLRICSGNERRLPGSPSRHHHTLLLPAKPLESWLGPSSPSPWPPGPRAFVLSPRCIREPCIQVPGVLHVQSRVLQWTEERHLRARRHSLGLTEQEFMVFDSPKWVQFLEPAVWAGWFLALGTHYPVDTHVYLNSGPNNFIGRTTNIQTAVSEYYKLERDVAPR